MDLPMSDIDNNRVINNMKKNKQLYITSVKHLTFTILFVVCCISLHKCNTYKNNLKDTTKMYVIANDSIITYRNRLGEEVAKTEVLTTSNAKLFTSLEFANADVRKLQDIVKRYEKANKDVSSALYIVTNTFIHFKDSIKNAISGWEQPNKDSCYKYPTYTKNFDLKDCFTTGTVELGYSKFDIQLKTSNQYEVVIGEEKDGWFKKKSFAEITNKNKCTTTEVMKVYDKIEKPTKTGRTLLIGAGSATAIIILLTLL